MEHVRNLTAIVIAPALRLTGFRFSKDYRHKTTRYHAIVYATCNTVLANSFADSIAGGCRYLRGYYSK